MTVSTAGSTVSYAGNDVTTTFGLPFPYQLDSDLIVTTTTSGAVTTLVLGTDYTVNPAQNSPANNGSVLTTNPVASGTTITIRRAVPLTQLTTWQTNDAYPANFYRVENALDKLTMALNDAADQPINPGGDASTFVRGDGTLSNTLVGTLGAFDLPADTSAVMIAGQTADAAIKVVSGNTSQGAFRYSVDGDTNPWQAQWVYDPQLPALGWQFYGGPIIGTFTSSGIDVSTGTINGEHTGSADASILTSGTVPLARLGTNSPAANLFLNGANQWSVPAGGGGGINTTTTDPFTIAAVNSSQTVSVTDASGIAAGTYLQISDGTHTIIGLVTAVASLDLTVKTTTIVLGIAGNTMASGSVVQAGLVGGNNSILITDADIPPTLMTTMQMQGSMVEYDASAGVVPLFAFNQGNGAQIITGYVPTGSLTPFAMKPDSPPDGTCGLIGFSSSASTVSGTIQPTARYQVPVCLTFHGGLDPHPLTLGWSLIDNNSITPSSLTPALLNVTNSLTDTYLFGYDSASQHFKMFAPPTALPSGTAGQFINGLAAATNALRGGDAALVVSQDTSGSSVGTVFASGVGSLSGGQIYPIQYSGASYTQVTANPPPINLLAPISVGGASFTTNNVSDFNTNVRVAYSMRSDRGFWNKIHAVTNPTGTQTIDPATAPYWRFESINSNFTIALADTTTVPSSTSQRGAAEVTLEFDPIGVAYVVTWPGTITWVDGGTAPVMPTGTDVTIIKLIRAQDVGDGHGAKWFGYRLATSAAAAYTDAQARSAVIDSTRLIDSSTIAMNVVAGTSATPAVIAGSIGNTQLASGIQPSKLQGYPTDATKFLNGAGGWTVPPGGGGSFSPATSYVWTAAQTYNATNTFTKEQDFTITPASPYTSSSLQVAIGDAAGPVGNYTGVSVFLDNGAPTASSGNMQPAVFWHQMDNPGNGLQSVQNVLDIRGNANWSAGHPGKQAFFLNLTAETMIRQFNTLGTSDSLWFTSCTPDINYSAMPDRDGITHTYTTGAVRIGEVNYGNAWGDFGISLSPQIGPVRQVYGMGFFPDVITGAVNDAAPHKYHATWGIVIGNAAVSSFGETPKNWIGLSIDQDGIVGKNDHGSIIGGGSAGDSTGGGGYGINISGSTDSSNPIGKAINTNLYMDIGVDLSASTFTTTAIKMATDQTITLGGSGASTILIRAHGGHIEGSLNNGSSWSTIL